MLVLVAAIVAATLLIAASATAVTTSLSAERGLNRTQLRIESRPETSGVDRPTGSYQVDPIETPSNASASRRAHGDY